MMLMVDEYRAVERRLDRFPVFAMWGLFWGLEWAGVGHANSSHVNAHETNKTGGTSEGLSEA